MISTSKSPIKLGCIYSWRVIGNAYFDIWKPAIQYHYGTKTDKVSMMIYCEELNLRASIHQPMSYHATRPIHLSMWKNFLLLIKFRCVFCIENIIPSEELHLVLNF